MSDDDLDTALLALREAQANAATLTPIVINLRQNARQLLDPLKTVLEEARDALDHALTLLEDRP
jgi:hypothetical protein